MTIMLGETEIRRPRATMTVAEVADLLGLSESATYDAAARGDLPTLKIGRRVLVIRSAVLALLGEEPIESSEPSP